MAHHEAIRNRSLSFKFKSGAVYGVVGDNTTMPLAESYRESADKPVVERSVVTAVGRLIVSQFPPYLNTTHNHATFLGVDDRPSQGIAFMSGACGDGTVGQHTPHASLSTRGMGATVVDNVDHPVLGKSLAVRCRLIALDIKAI